jgi:sugar phosphate isomerase/epimerase
VTDLCLWAGTLAGHDLWTRVRAAGRAGFGSLSAAPCELAAVVAAGDEHRLRSALRASSVRLACLDPVPTWLPDPVPAHPAHRIHAAVPATACLDLAERFDIRLVNAIDVTWRPLPAGAFAHLAAFAARARRRGIAVVVEAQVYSGIPTFGAARDLCRGIGNAGLTVDAWHFFRDRTSRLADLCGVRIGAVQLADGPARAGTDAVAESIGGRLMPGFGDFALPAFADAVGAPSGCVIGPEVFADVPADRVDDAAATALSASRAVLAARRGTSGAQAQVTVG